MRVLQLVGRSTGGIGTHVGELVRDLRALGIDVVVVAHPVTAERFGWADARTCWPRNVRRPRAVLRDLLRLRALMARADVVHAHGHQAGLLATVLSLVAPRAVVVVSQHNLVLPGTRLRRAKAAVQRFVARRADLVTGASTDLVLQAQALGARDARLARVPSPKVPALLAAPVLDGPGRVALRRHLLGPVDAGLPLVLTISRIAPQKDLGTLVEAAAALQPPCRWVVVGDGDPDLRRGLEDRIRRTGAPVTLVGARTDAADLLRAADVFVLPSTWEARALVVQEAMAAGVPVVTSDSGGLPDLVEGVGLLVPVGDAAGLARQVAAVLLDPDLRDRLSGLSRTAAAELPDGRHAAGEWLGWYDAALAARRRRPACAPPGMT